MSVLVSKLFWIDTAERAVKTVSQAILSLWLVGDVVFNLLEVNFEQTLGVALGAGVISVLMSIGSSGSGNSASLVVDSKKQ